MKKLLKYLPGLALTITIGWMAKNLTHVIDNVGSVTLAILLGLVAGNIFKLGDTFQPGVKFSEKRILSLAIMLLGLKLNLQILSSLGVQTLLFIVIMVSLSVVTGLIIGRGFGLSRSFALLLGIGNGICGSSAIAAAAPILDANEEETGLSISVVNLLGTLGIFLLPLILQVITQFDHVTNGLLIGGTLQAVGHVTAAGFTMGEQVGTVATIVKMGRILMLGPILIMMGIFFGKKSTGEKTGFRFPVPPFIIGFFILSIVGSINLIPADLLSWLKGLSKEALIVAMAGIGLKIRLSSLLKQGPRALLVGSFVFGVQIMSGIILLLLLY